MSKQRNAKTGMTWHVHNGYARSHCKHRTNQAMQKCAERTMKLRARDQAQEAKGRA